MSDAVPVRSDRCGLDELFLSFETGDDAERARLALGPGWTRQGTATWQVPGGDEGALVRDLGPAPATGCAPGRRPGRGGAGAGPVAGSGRGGGVAGQGPGAGSGGRVRAGPPVLVGPSSASPAGAAVHGVDGAGARGG